MRYNLVRCCVARASSFVFHVPSAFARCSLAIDALRSPPHTHTPFSPSGTVVSPHIIGKCTSEVFNYIVNIGVAPEESMPNHLVIQTSVEPKGGVVKVDTAGVGKKAALINTILLRLYTPPTEKIFGLGVQYSVRNLKGRVVPVVTSEQGIGRGLEPITKILNLARDSGGNWHTTYSAIPHYTTSESRSFFLENSEYSIFDLSDPEVVSIQTFGTTVTARALYATSPLNHVEVYTEYAGRLPALPSWVMEGPIVGYEGGTKAVAALYAKLVSVGIRPVVSKAVEPCFPAENLLEDTDGWMECLAPAPPLAKGVNATHPWPLAAVACGLLLLLTCALLMTSSHSEGPLHSGCKIGRGSGKIRSGPVENPP